MKLGEFGMAEMDFSALIDLPDAPPTYKAHAYNGRGGLRFARKDFWKSIDDHSEVCIQSGVCVCVDNVIRQSSLLRA